MTTPLRIIFAGTPTFAAKHLQAIIESEHQLLAVYTQPDRPAGRGKKLKPSDVKVLAEANGIEVQQPPSLKSEEAQATLAAYQADLMIVVAYGLLLPKAVLEIPKFGCINVHGSILPRWRGAAPIQRAIEAGDTQSGVTIMQMDVGLDTGDMLLKQYCDILPTDSSGDLHDRMCEIGPPALLQTLSHIAAGQTSPEKQDDELSNYASKIDKHEAQINWQEPAELIDRKIRAFNPFPICFTDFRGQRLKIHRAALLSSATSSDGTPAPGTLTLDQNQLKVQCGAGELVLTSLQLPGKKAISAAEFINAWGEQLQSADPIVLGISA
ncbi:Methionyl-tRNA formyltransferase [Thalassocella blandensis]|nr:Methionyl-tRNA formyltransferase [Thalassocella blandensis]